RLRHLPRSLGPRGGRAGLRPRGGRDAGCRRCTGERADGERAGGERLMAKTLVPVDTTPGHRPGLPVPARPAPRPRIIAVWAVMLGLLAASVWSFVDLDFSFATFARGFAFAADFLSRMFPLVFPPLPELVSLTLETLAIVTVATALAVVLSLPVALLAASSTTTHRWAGAGARTFIVIMRAIPDLVLAIFFFRLFGLGAVPGILAMGLHSIGMIGKLYADAIEELDRGPLEALRAAGASRRQQIWSGIIPPLMPQIIATALHRFDINLRTSVILGYVGVGGIGLAMSEALNTMNYQRGMALALVVLVLCVVVELISAALRTALLGRDPHGASRARERAPPRDPRPARPYERRVGHEADRDARGAARRQGTHPHRAAVGRRPDPPVPRHHGHAPDRRDRRRGQRHRSGRPRDGPRRHPADARDVLPAV